MTITVTPSSGRIGPGSHIFVTCDAATVHYISAGLADYTVPAGGANAWELSGFAGDTLLHLGFVNSPNVANKLDSGNAIVGLADGAACTLLVSAFDVTDTLLEYQSFTGFLWDPVSHVSQLLGRLYEQIGVGGGPTLSAILAAVRKTY